MGCTVIGCGKAVPAREVSNDDLSRLVDTTDEWIVQRTGIRTRRISTTETATDLAVAASRAALGLPATDRIEAAGWTGGNISPAAGACDPTETLQSIDLLICMTISPDATVPSQAALVRSALGLSNAVAFDLNAACTGCVYGMTVAESMITSSNLAAGARGNRIRRALVVGVERLSRITDWTDRTTCVLFGDGAGAVVLEWNDEKPGILSSFLKNTDDDEFSLARRNLFDYSTFPFPHGNDGEKAAGAAGGADDAGGSGAAGGAGGSGGKGGAASGAAAGGEKAGGSHDIAATFSPFITMNGQQVFKFATYAMVEAIETALERAQIDIDDVACIVPHQANERIIRYAAKKLGAPIDLFQVSIASTANTSAASALMALADAYLAGRINEGDKVVVAGFGGGLTSGAALFEA